MFQFSTINQIEKITFFAWSASTMQLSNISVLTYPLDCGVLQRLHGRRGPCRRRPCRRSLYPSGVTKIQALILSVFSRHSVLWVPAWAVPTMQAKPSTNKRGAGDGGYMQRLSIDGRGMQSLSRVLSTNYGGAEDHAIKNFDDELNKK